MLEEGKINSKQATLLMVSMVLPTTLLFVASVTAHLAKQDGWISILLATLAGLLIAQLAVNLSLRFPGKTLFQYLEVILGKWPGKVVTLLFIWWFIQINAEILRQYGSFMVSAFMPETPIIVLELLITLIAAYAVRNGLEVFTRANEIILPVILGLIIIVNILLTPEVNLKRLLPVFIENGAVPVIKGAVMPAAWMGEIVTIAVLIPYLNKAKEAYRVAAAATLITGGFLIFTFVGDVAIFGPEVTAGWIFPSLNKVRMIHLANFLERLEAFVMFIWIAGGLIKICVFYWVAVLGSAQCLELKDYKPLVLPVGVILLALSIMAHDSILDLFTFLGRFWGPYALIVFEAGIPLLLLIIAVIRGQGVKQN
ncbi:MAG: Spore germination protein YndE [Pelotomaculum sp. PtaB.Bin104]|nr:MAG: Spore germination protein YndE [Pelotomaculum sp. PtaB.Bin104]